MTKYSESWSISRLAFYQIAPGLATLILFIPFVWLLSNTGIPRMVALFMAILLGEVPLTWYLMTLVMRQEGKKVTRENLFPWRSNLGRRRLFLIGLPMVLVSMIIVFGLATVAEAPIRDTVFYWVPDQFVLVAGPNGMVGASKFGMLLLWIVSGFGGVATQTATHIS